MVWVVVGGVGGGGVWLTATFPPLGSSGYVLLPLFSVLGECVPLRTKVIFDSCFPAPDTETFVMALVAVFGLLSEQPAVVPKTQSMD